MRQRALLASASGIAHGAVDVDGVRLASLAVADAAGADDLRALALDVRARMGDAEPVVVALAATMDGRPSIVVATNGPARAAGLRAGDLVKSASQALGGGGGGKPDLAQGGGQDSAAIPAALGAITASVGKRG